MININFRYLITIIMKKLPYRGFSSPLDKILERVPLMGKIMSSLFGLVEVYLLEFFRKLDDKFNITTINFVNRYLFKGRWGGKVIPLGLNMSTETRFLPSQEILSLLSRSNVVGIATCYCRDTQRKHSKEPNCDHPINTCIHISTGKSLYDVPFKSENLKKVSKQEIRNLLEECDRRGLVHQIIYFPNPKFYYVVCNCCSCCCEVMNKFLKGGSPQMIKSDFIAETNYELCNDCGDCEAWCHFGARIIKDQKLKFLPELCFGCGICISKCPNNAILLRSRILH
jgi:ferredoxin